MKKQLLLIVAIGLCSTSILGVTKTNATEDPQNNTKQLGLLGYYYQSSDFKKTMMIAPMTDNVLGYEQEAAKDLLTEEETDFQSVRWIGSIKVNKTDEYEFKLTHDELASIEIDGKLVSKLGKEKVKQTLEKDSFYDIKIEYRLSSSSIETSELLKKTHLIKQSSKCEEIVGLTELSLPDLKDTAKTTMSPNDLALDGQTLSYSNYDPEEEKDPDNDKITTGFEKNGYTVQKKTLVKWSDELASKGYKKYVSNPHEAHTAGDPYTDLEKALGRIDPGSKKAAYNPLVAAYPRVNVTMERFILSDTSTQSNSFEFGMKIGSSKTDSIGGSADVEISMFPSVSVSVNRNHSSTTTAEKDQSSSSHVSFSNSERAHFNANIRYHNIGTGAIHEVTPTTSFAINNHVFQTITAESNTITSTLSAGDSYPKKGEGSIALLTSDQFNSSPIVLNNEQYTSILNGAPVTIETNQVEGKYLTADARGTLELGESWGPYQAQIEAKTASILIVEENGETAERQIVGKDYTDADDTNPQITLKEALKIGYPNEITEQDGELYYKGKILYQEMFSIDKITKKILEANKNSTKGASIFDCFISPNMFFNIQLNKPLRKESIQKAFSQFTFYKSPEGATKGYQFYLFHNIKNKLHGLTIKNVRVSYTGPNKTYNITRRPYEYDQDGNFKINLFEYYPKSLERSASDKLQLFAQLSNGEEIKILENSGKWQ